MILSDAMRELHGALQAALLGTASVSHRLSKGEMRERKLRQALRPFVPSGIRLATGHAVNSVGEESRQQDVLFADDLRSTPFASVEDMVVLPVEIVAASLQVKSSLRASDIEGAVQNIASLKRLQPVIQRTAMVDQGMGVMSPQWRLTKPFGAVIAWALEGEIKGVQDAFLEANRSLPSEDRCNVLLVLDGTLLTWSRTGDGLSFEMWPPAAKSLICIGSQDPPDVLLLFWGLLTKHLQEYLYPELEVFRYLNRANPKLTCSHRNIE